MEEESEHGHSTVPNTIHIYNDERGNYCAFGRMEIIVRTTHDDDGNKVPSNSINPLYSLYSILLLEYDVDFDDYIILSVTVAVVLYST